MIAVVNRLPVKEGAAGRLVERFAEGRGHVQRFPGFLSMEVMRSEAGDEVLVVTRWRNRASFDAWGRSEELSLPSARPVPRLTLKFTR
jgi:heme oxygenase (staphylobilin-producing)